MRKGYIGLGFLRLKKKALNERGMTEMNKIKYKEG